MRSITILFIIASLFITNCSTTYQVKFEDPDPELITTEKLNSFLAEKDDVRIVLRTAEKSDDMTEAALNPIYNTIEKELLKAGFIIRDRAVFNQVSTSNQQINYSELHKQTDTDLILELVDFNTKLSFTTNTYYDDGDQETFRDDHTITYYGAEAEFRIVLLEQNEFSGSYSFTYAPCIDGCPITIAPNTGEPEYAEEEVDEELNDDPFQYISKSELEQFMRSATQRLINEIR